MGLFGRTREMMKGWAPATPPPAQRFNVACAEGHRIQGERTEGYQAIRCPVCGRGIFVLPRSPLPLPAQPASKKPSPTRVPSAGPSWEPAGVGPELSELPPGVRMTEHHPDEEPASETSARWEERLPPNPAIDPNQEIDFSEPDRPVTPPPPASAPPPSQSPKHPARPRKAIKTRSSADQVTRDGQGVDQEVAPGLIEINSETWPDWIFRQRTKLICSAAILAVIVTVAYRIRRQHLQDLPRIAELGRVEGLKLLDAGDFAAAKPILSRAADAVRQLGGEFEGAEDILQGAREAAIFADLVPETLESILDEAATFGQPDQWPRRFETAYAGRSVILDARITGVPAEPGGKHEPYQIDYRILFGRGPRPAGRGVIDLTGFRLFELARPKLGDQVRFGARLAGVVRDPSSGQWVVTLQPDSGTFIIRQSALETLGWPADGDAPGPAPR